MIPMKWKAGAIALAGFVAVAVPTSSAFADDCRPRSSYESRWTRHPAPRRTHDRYRHVVSTPRYTPRYAPRVIVAPAPRVIVRQRPVYVTRTYGPAHCAPAPRYCR